MHDILLSQGIVLSREGEDKDKQREFVRATAGSPYSFILSISLESLRFLLLRSTVRGKGIEVVCACAHYYMYLSAFFSDFKVYRYKSVSM